MVRLLQVLLRFYHHESCGQCTPCREGMGWLHRIIDRIVAGEGRPEDIERLYHDLRMERRHHDLRHGRRRRLRHRRHPRQVPRRVRVLHRATSARAATGTSECLRDLHRRPAGRGRARPDRDAGGARATASTSRTSAGTRSCRSPATAASAWSQVEGRSWVEIACNMPVSRRACACCTDSELVRAHRKAMLQLITLNHPVDCGICDKAGECTLQDYHYQYNGAPSVSRDAKVRVDQVPPALRAHRARQRALHPVLALRALHARDLEVERARHPAARRPLAGARRRGRPFDARPVLRQRHRPLPGRRAAVAAVPATRRASGTCSRRRRSARAARAAARSRSGTASPNGSSTRSTRAQNARIERVTPLENPAVNGPWICNKGRDLAQSSSGRAPTQAMMKGQPVELDAAIEQRARADRRGDATRWRWCRTGARTRSSPRSSARSARASPPSSSTTACRSRASASRTTC